MTNYRHQAAIKQGKYSYINFDKTSTNFIAKREMKFFAELYSPTLLFAGCANLSM